MATNNAINISYPIYTATISLTSAQIKAFPTTAITLISAPGSGKYIYILNAATSYTYGGTNAFSGSTANILYFYGSNATTTGDGTLLQTTALTGTASVIYTTVPTAIVGGATSSLANAAIVINTPSGSTAYGGNAAANNSAKIYVNYQILPT